ncbi:MAG: hypothetical protein LBH19_02105 [Dysgonamonadaceae bacterium]|jgi:hypothetical protein|nr:hypothetical protein [Dysgonamonadaceae bacterium]
MIPDYVQQVYEIHGALAKQALAAQEDWLDSVAKRYYEKFIDKYEEKVNLYINGGMDITGKGLNELLVFFDEKEREMAALGGMDMGGSGNYGGKIHNEYRERVNWDNYRGANPSQLNAPEIKGIMNERNRK